MIRRDQAVYDYALPQLIPSFAFLILALPCRPIL
jgi:hypothetical protein